ncbi:type II toxin-antitoxin system HicB family antitoxin [Desulfosarcina ovata]|uniref:HicB family protein n=1 Tax=Desulfosarcina ovata subsp. ovata TaxID=2752305 RepID=A0A5K8A7Q6_9BACT|nr:hypothetical protein [Desulfosarcina ovata]BBO88511.1 hypothetical protein DSCOOX_16910 [Desulfosarcina ovata subsp. ovata]
MKYRAVVKKKEGWWIGWLIDLPGVNAQERTKSELLESLKLGAQEMLFDRGSDQAGCLIGAGLGLKIGCFLVLNRCFGGPKERFKKLVDG